MANSGESLEGHQQDLRSTIEKSANLRASYTRSYLENNGMNIEDFVKTLGSAPFEISIDHKDDKSLSLGIFNLQKKLGFPETDSSKGCDGKFGAYTRKSFEQMKLQSTTGMALGSQSGAIADQLTDKESPTKSPSLTETVSLKDTVFVGDSLTVMMGNFIPGAVKAYKGAMQTGWMKTELLKVIADYKKGKHPGLKRVVIMGGFNDISSTKGSRYVINNLREMYTAAKAAGLSVVGCTIPDWDYENLQKTWVERWKKRGWGKEKGVYPYTAAELEQQTLEVNKWIFSQQGTLVDTTVDTYNGGFERSNDGIHRTTNGSKKMATSIMQQANIQA